MNHTINYAVFCSSTRVHSASVMTEESTVLFFELLQSVSDSSNVVFAGLLKVHAWTQLAALLF